jgi:osmotically-inducible protein OsmY
MTATPLPHSPATPRSGPGRRAPGWSALLLALAAATVLPGCAPLVVGAAVGTALAVTDRRTSGAQLEDEAIEIKAINRVAQAVGSRGHVNVTSYNRTVLITGEVRSEDDRVAVERALAGIENVRGTVNELAVMGASSLTSRTSDGLITSKVKATFIDAKDVQASAVKVVTERGVVHLMGLVTEREADRAVELARSVSGVGKVVRVFELVSEAELAKLQPPRK